MKQVFAITGMHCAACAASIERAVGKVPGVTSATVNLLTEQLFVEQEPLDTASIIERVHKTGFEARVVDPHQRQQSSAEERQKEWHQAFIRVRFVAVFAALLFYVAMGGMMGLPLPSAISMDSHPLRYALAQLILLFPIVYTGRNFYTGGLSALFHRAPNMDSLIAIGTCAAILYSLFSTLEISRGNLHAVHQLYFESAGVIIALVLLGKFFEERSKGKTSEAISRLTQLVPEKALVLKNGIEALVPIEDIALKDQVVMKPGGRFPVDGTVVQGYSAVNEAMLTGESIPVEKTVGDTVIAGSINLNGSLVFEATRIGDDTTLARLIRMVEDAQMKKAPIARLADTVSGYFVPTVIVIATLAFAGWMLAGKDLAFSLNIFISVLVIACPCALGLATPTAIMVGTGKGAELGILFKSGEALEKTQALETLVFDKTGTITEGKPRLTAIYPQAGFSEESVLRYAASVEKGSEHPIASALLNAAEERGIDVEAAQDFCSVPGKGVKGQLDGHEVFLGNQALMQSLELSTDAKEALNRLADEGNTPILLLCDQQLAAVLAVADTVKPESQEAMKTLQSMGFETIMITGDNERTAQAVAGGVGIGRVLSGILPDGKAHEIQRLQEEGKKVGMVGDGINDAPALACSDVGFAVGSGIDIAIESADVILVRDDLRDIATAISLSRRTLATIRQNLFWAFIYNVAGIPFAAGLLYLFGGPLLNPMIAALAMSFSSLSVVGNALRLRNFVAPLSGARRSM